MEDMYLTPAQYEEARRDGLIGKDSRRSLYQSLAALVLIVVGTPCAGAGMAWWIHPGAGLLVVGLLLCIYGVLFGVSS